MFNPAMMVRRYWIFVLDKRELIELPLGSNENFALERDPLHPRTRRHENQWSSPGIVEKTIIVVNEFDLHGVKTREIKLQMKGQAACDPILGTNQLLLHQVHKLPEYNTWGPFVEKWLSLAMIRPMRSVGVYDADTGQLHELDSVRMPGLVEGEVSQDGKYLVITRSEVCFNRRRCLNYPYRPAWLGKLGVRGSLASGLELVFS